MRTFLSTFVGFRHYLRATPSYEAIQTSILSRCQQPAVSMPPPVGTMCREPFHLWSEVFFPRWVERFNQTFGVENIFWRWFPLFRLFLRLIAGLFRSNWVFLLRKNVCPAILNGVVPLFSQIASRFRASFSPLLSLFWHAI